MEEPRNVGEVEPLVKRAIGRVSLEGGGGKEVVVQDVDDLLVRAHQTSAHQPPYTFSILCCPPVCVFMWLSICVFVWTYK